MSISCASLAGTSAAGCAVPRRTKKVAENVLAELIEAGAHGPRG
jgi:hypothetical protein